MSCHNLVKGLDYSSKKRPLKVRMYPDDIIRVAFESRGFHVFEIYVGNTNALKRRGHRARSGQFNGIANIN